MGRTEDIARERLLVERIRKRDEQALAELYDAYSGALYGVILKVVQVEEVAADILQEVFVKIWQKMDAYNAKKGRLFTWMLNISRNRAIDYLRSNAGKYQSRVRSIEDFVHRIETAHPTEQKVDYIGLREVVDKLAPEHRILIEKVYFLGFTQAEVAKELDIPLGTVKSRIRIAMRELRKRMS